MWEKNSPKHTIFQTKPFGEMFLLSHNFDAEYNVKECIV